MFTIENEQLKVVINAKGAELSSIYNKITNLEYLWSGDPAFWGKKSPVLFPIVGTIKGDTYYYQNNTYHLSRHGFAREAEFTITDQSDSSITCTLSSNETTLKAYPFEFQFSIVYSINDNKLDVSYQVINTGTGSMYFSVGGHPAFKVPLRNEDNYTDYFLEFNKSENSDRWPISGEGLIELNSVPFLNNSKRISLTKELFYKDALVFKDLKSTNVKLLSDKSANGIEFNFSGFPFLGIWAAKNADFVCIEPWCGIADSVDTNQQLKEKEGINKLNASEKFKRNWSVTVF